MPALGLGVTVACCTGRAPAPRTVRGLVDGGALAVTRPTLLLPVSGLVAPGRGLWTATGIAECACALGVTVCGLDECARDLLAVARPGMTARGRMGPATGHVTVAGLVTAPLLLTVRGLGRGVGGLDGVIGTREEAAVASRARCDSGLTVAHAPAFAGGATALPTSSFPDLVRLVLSLSGSVEQRGAVLGSLLSTAAVTGAGGVPAPAVPVPTAAAIACSPSVLTPGGSTSACAASATASHG